MVCLGVGYVLEHFPKGYHTSGTGVDAPLLTLPLFQEKSHHLTPLAELNRLYCAVSDKSCTDCDYSKV